MKYSLAVMALLGHSSAFKLQQKSLRQLTADDFSQTGENSYSQKDLNDMALQEAQTEETEQQQCKRHISFVQQSTKTHAKSGHQYESPFADDEYEFAQAQTAKKHKKHHKKHKKALVQKQQNLNQSQTTPDEQVKKEEVVAKIEKGAKEGATEAEVPKKPIQQVRNEENLKKFNDYLWDPKAQAEHEAEEKKKKEADAKAATTKAKEEAAKIVAGTDNKSVPEKAADAPKDKKDAVVEAKKADEKQKAKDKEVDTKSSNEAAKAEEKPKATKESKKSLVQKHHHKHHHHKHEHSKEANVEQAPPTPVTPAVTPNQAEATTVTENNIRDKKHKKHHKKVKDEKAKADTKKQMPAPVVAAPVAAPAMAEVTNKAGNAVVMESPDKGKLEITINLAHDKSHETAKHKHPHSHSKKSHHKNEPLSEQTQAIVDKVKSEADTKEKKDQQKKEKVATETKPVVAEKKQEKIADKTEVKEKVDKTEKKEKNHEKKHHHKKHSKISIETAEDKALMKDKKVEAPVSHAAVDEKEVMNKIKESSHVAKESAQQASEKGEIKLHQKKKHHHKKAKKE